MDEENEENEDENDFEPNSVSSYSAQESFLNEHNILAEKLISLNMWVRSFSKKLAFQMPLIPIVKFNDEKSNEKMFANSLVIQRPTNYAENLYQLNTELKDHVRRNNQKY